MKTHFKKIIPFGPRVVAARKFRLSRKHSVKLRLRRASISGTTWPGEAIAIAERPHVIHNITYHK